MSVKIQIKRANASAWTAANPTLAAGEWGMELDTKKLKLGTGALWNSTDYYSETLTLNSVGDVTITSLQNGDFLRYSSSASAWINDPVNLSTDTVGDYVQSLTAGTGVTLSNNSGEGATPTVAIGQAVGTSASVTFGQLTVSGQTNVGGNIIPNTNEAYDLGSASARFRDIYLSGTTINLGGAEITSNGTDISFSGGIGVSGSANFVGDLTGNADTATTLETSRAISLAGDLSGSASFDGSSDITITATVQPNSIALGTDTTGNYVATLTAGTGITLANNSGENASPTVTVDTTVIQARVTNVTDTEIGYLDGVTSAIQTQMDLKAPLASPTFTGTVTLPSGTVTSAMILDETIVNADISASAAIADTKLATISTASKVSNSATTATNANTASAIVARDASGNFAAGTITAALSGNASTASTLETARTISISGDVSGSVSFNGSSAVDISATIQPNSVSLGTDTTGNYVNDVTAGTGVSVTHTPGEGSSPTIAIGQAVGTSASVTFAKVDTTGDVTVGGNLTVNGTTTTLNTETLSVEDNIVVLNSNGTGSPTLNAGLEVERGDSANVVLRWNESTDKWETTNDGSAYSVIATNGNIALGTDTTGNFVNDVTAGTGVSVTHTPGEGSSPTIAIGQAVSTSSSVTFGHVSAPVTGNVTGNLTGNADTAATLQTPRTISLSGDVSGSVSFNGSANVDISATVQPNSVALGTDTTGNYMSDLTQGTGVSITHTPGEGSNATIAIGQAVGTSSSVQFAAVTAPLIGNASTASALETTRTISLTGDVSGSVSFNGSADASISATIQPNSVSLGTDTTGNYVNDLTAGTGVTVTHTPGEGSSPTVAIGQAVGTSSSVTFAAVTAPVTGNVTGDVTGNAGTATALQTSRASSLGGDLSGSVSFNGTSDVTITAAVQPNSVALGTDTSGDYVQSLVAGTGVTLTNNSGETSTPTVAIGQAVGTSASVTFAAVTAPLIGNASTATVLQTARNIAGQSFDGSANISIAPTDLTGVTSSAAELNILDGATLSTAELNYVDGVTSAIQTQIDSKAPSASPTFTGTVTLPDNTVALGTKTTGDYVASLVAGTGVTLTNNSGETATPTIAIGQAVGTSASVTFANLTLSGDLIVSGTTTTINSETLTVDDNIIVLNNNATGAPSQNAGIEIERGSSNNVALRWNETSDKWEVTEDGSTYVDIATVSYVDGQTINTLDDISDVSTASAASGDFLKWNGSAWVNDPINLGSDTVGNYVNDITAGTGVTVTHTPGEGSSATVAIGQAVGTSSSVTFAAVTAPLIGNVTGNADTATALATSRTIELTGDVTGSVSFNGSANASITATIAANSVALGTDTTGNYMSALVAGTGITVTFTPGEGSSASVAVDTAVIAPLDSPYFTGTPFTPQPSYGDASEKIANTQYVQDELQYYALEASPVFTGVPEAPNPPIGDSTSQIVNSNWVQGELSTLELDSLNDVVIVGTSLGQSLVYNGSEWANANPYLNDLFDVESAGFGTANGSLLKYDENGPYWTAGTIALDEISNVDASAPDMDAFLQWNGTNWIPNLLVIPSPNLALDELNDVSVGSPTTGHFLKWDGTEWVAAAAGGAVTTTSVTTASATEIYSFDPTLYGTAEVTLQLKQGSKKTSSRQLVNHDGTTASLTEYAKLQHGSPVIPATLGVSYDAGIATWTTRTSNFGTTQIFSVAYGNSLWVAGGKSGQLRTSTDAITWTTQTSNFGNTGIDSIAYGNSLWVAGGYAGQLRTSTDAITWTTRTLNLGNQRIQSVAYGNNLWVAGATNGQLRTSTDAITWTTQTSNFGSSAIFSVAYGNNLWVAGGYNGELRTSTNAITWTTRTSNFEESYSRILSVAYANSLWVAAGYYGLLSTSTDAITWVTRTSNFGTSPIQSVAYGNNLWVAGGNYGELRSSTDAITWTTRTSNFGATTTIQSVAYGNSLWVAAGMTGQIRTASGSPKVSVTATITDANVTTATSKATLVLTEE